MLVVNKFRFLLLIVALCTAVPAYAQPAEKMKLTYKLIPAPGNTWGYDIYRNDKLFVHQPNRPALPGEKGFATKEQAKTVALMVIVKIRRGEMPPAVSIEELKKAHAL